MMLQEILNSRLRVNIQGTLSFTFLSFTFIEARRFSKCSHNFWCNSWSLPELKTRVLPESKTDPNCHAACAPTSLLSDVKSRDVAVVPSIPATCVGSSE